MVFFVGSLLIFSHSILHLRMHARTYARKHTKVQTFKIKKIKDRVDCYLHFYVPSPPCKPVLRVILYPCVKHSFRAFSIIVTTTITVTSCSNMITNMNNNNKWQTNKQHWIAAQPVGTTSNKHKQKSDKFRE